MLLLFVACALAWTADDALLVLPLVTLAALVGYALPWLLWREKAEHKRGLWLVVLEPDGDGARRGALTLRLVDTLAQRWRDGPVTVVLDAAFDLPRSLRYAGRIFDSLAHVATA